MKLGAVLIAAGKNANPLLPSGEITVAQRMIATLQKTGVIRITVVTGPSDKKMEKQLAQYGVFFLQNPQPENQGTSISLGIHSLGEIFQRKGMITSGHYNNVQKLYLKL